MPTSRHNPTPASPAPSAALTIPILVNHRQSHQSSSTSPTEVEHLIHGRGQYQYQYQYQYPTTPSTTCHSPLPTFSHSREYPPPLPFPTAAAIATATTPPPQIVVTNPSAHTNFSTPHGSPISEAGGGFPSTLGEINHRLEQVQQQKTVVRIPSRRIKRKEPPKLYPAQISPSSPSFSKSKSHSSSSPLRSNFIPTPTQNPSSASPIFFSKPAERESPEGQRNQRSVLLDNEAEGTKISITQRPRTPPPLPNSTFNPPSPSTAHLTLSPGSVSPVRAKSITASPSPLFLGAELPSSSISLSASPASSSLSILSASPGSPASITSAGFLSPELGATSSPAHSPHPFAVAQSPVAYNDHHRPGHHRGFSSPLLSGRGDLSPFPSPLSTPDRELSAIPEEAERAPGNVRKLASKVSFFSLNKDINSGGETSDTLNSMNSLSSASSSVLSSSGSGTRFGGSRSTSGGLTRSMTRRISDDAVEGEFGRVGREKNSASPAKKNAVTGLRSMLSIGLGRSTTSVSAGTAGTTDSRRRPSQGRGQDATPGSQTVFAPLQTPQPSSAFSDFEIVPTPTTPRINLDEAIFNKGASPKAIQLHGSPTTAAGFAGIGSSRQAKVARKNSGRGTNGMGRGGKPKSSFRMGSVDMRMKLSARLKGGRSVSSGRDATSSSTLSERDEVTTSETGEETDDDQAVHPKSFSHKVALKPIDTTSPMSSLRLPTTLSRNKPVPSAFQHTGKYSTKEGPMHIEISADDDSHPSANQLAFLAAPPSPVSTSERQERQPPGRHLLVRPVTNSQVSIGVPTPMTAWPTPRNSRSRSLLDGLQKGAAVGAAPFPVSEAADSTNVDDRKKKRSSGTASDRTLRAEEASKRPYRPSMLFPQSPSSGVTLMTQPPDEATPALESLARPAPSVSAKPMQGTSREDARAPRFVPPRVSIKRVPSGRGRLHHKGAHLTPIESRKVREATPPSSEATTPVSADMSAELATPILQLPSLNINTAHLASSGSATSSTTDFSRPFLTATTPDGMFFSPPYIATPDGKFTTASDGSRASKGFLGVESSIAEEDESARGRLESLPSDLRGILTRQDPVAARNTHLSFATDDDDLRRAVYSPGPSTAGVRSTRTDTLSRSTGTRTPTHMVEPPPRTSSRIFSAGISTDRSAASHRPRNVSLSSAAKPESPSCLPQAYDAWPVFEPVAVTSVASQPVSEMSTATLSLMVAGMGDFQGKMLSEAEFRLLVDVAQRLKVVIQELAAKYGSELRKRRRAFLYLDRMNAQKETKQAARVIKVLSRMTETVDGDQQRLFVAQDQLRQVEGLLANHRQEVLHCAIKRMQQSHEDIVLALELEKADRLRMRNSVSLASLQRVVHGEGSQETLSPTPIKSTITPSPSSTPSPGRHKARLNSVRFSNTAPADLARHSLHRALQLSESPHPTAHQRSGSNARPGTRNSTYSNMDVDDWATAYRFPMPPEHTMPSPLPKSAASEPETAATAAQAEGERAQKMGKKLRVRTSSVDVLFYNPDLLRRRRSSHDLPISPAEPTSAWAKQPVRSVSVPPPGEAYHGDGRRNSSPTMVAFWSDHSGKLADEVRKRHSFDAAAKPTQPTMLALCTRQKIPLTPM